MATALTPKPLADARGSDRSRDRKGALAVRRGAARRTESGFALLLVFLMASLIAISLYMELPRVAFQAERQKEQLLMERGLQYKRAIGLFLRTNKRWPATIDELENFNNRRSLRKRYIDPMTGKDEWRLIHIQNGVLIDSLTNKKPNSQQSAGLQPTGFINEIQTFADQGSGTTGANPAMRRRPSDGGPTLGPDGQPIETAPNGADSPGNFAGIPPPPASAPPPPPGFPSGGVPGVPPGAPNGQGGIAGIMGGSSPGQTSAAGQTNNQSSGGLMGGLMGGLTGGGLMGSGSTTQPTVPGAPPQGFSGGAPPGFSGGAPPGMNGVPGNAQAGGIPINPSAQAAAAGLLQNLLTQPRPGGLPAGSAAATGAVMGSGIAGVASKVTGESIMVYGDHTDFSLWEFIYDPTKFQVQNPNAVSGSGPGVPASQLANNSGFSAPGTPIGTGPGGTQSAGPGGAQTMSASPAGGMPGGFGAGASAAGFSMGSGVGGTSSVSGSLGSSNTGAPGSGVPSAPAPATGSTAFGQPGLSTDIRPGKK